MCIKVEDWEGLPALYHRAIPSEYLQRKVTNVLVIYISTFVLEEWGKFINP